mmetsp:Transcript_106890/g.302295  ORF Transcript_106890/g.302295 Transcript_106890/m.302295 type:complete len:130 (+) Transcript_106890:1-390(+)
MRGPLARVLAACRECLDEEGPGAAASVGNHAAEGAHGGTIAEPTGPLVAEGCAAGCAAAGDVCAICIEPLVEDGALPHEAGPCLLPCGHGFHTGCLRLWLANSRHCPLCKRTVSGGALPRTVPASWAGA